MLPDKITIGAMDYAVLWDKSKIEEHCLKYQANAVGYQSEQKAEICVSPDLSEQAQRLTLVHEIIHGFEGACALDLDESDTERLANVLLATMRNNPEVVKYLMEGVA
jgi:hypothetical protein